MRPLTLAALTALGLAALSFPASAAPAGPVSGIAGPSALVTETAMRQRGMPRSSMTWVQRKRARR